MGKKARVSKDPKIRRQELLVAALELFQRTGYDATSVQMITDAVGISKGLFYHYFESKADLLNTLVAWQADLFLAGLPSSAAEMEGTGLGKMREIVRLSSQWKLGDLRDITRMYLEVMYSDENRGLRAALLSVYPRAVAPLWAEIIAEAVEEGVCHVDDPLLAAEMCLALAAGLNERFAELILGLEDDPRNGERLLVLMRGLDGAMERILGMAPGALQLYDHPSVANDLHLFLQEDPHPKGSR